MWQLEDRPSLRYVSETLRMRRDQDIELGFVECNLRLPTSSSMDSISLTSSSSATASPASVTASDGSKADATISLLSSLDGSSSGDEGSSMSIGERLAAQYAAGDIKERGLTPVQQRIKRRQEYQAAMDSVGAFERTIVTGLWRNPLGLDYHAY